MMILALLPLLSPEIEASPSLRATYILESPSVGDEVAIMDTSEGQIVLMFFPEVAPNHVKNFKTLAKSKFYDGTRFHRTMEGFMIQGGDPNSKEMNMAGRWGTGGNTDASGVEITVKAEFSDTEHLRGVLSMARSSNPDSASSQFFIMHGDAPHLDGQYSAFGRVVSGLEVVDRIATMPSGNNGSIEPANAVVLNSVRIVEWPLTKPKNKSKKSNSWTINGWNGIGR